MEGIRLRMRVWLGLVLIVSSLAGVTRHTQAEMYVGGQVGATIPYDLRDVEWSAGGASVRGNNLALHNSVMYGAKFGYYFDSLPWLGLETEVFNTTPHLKQQDWVVGGFPLGTAPGLNLRVLTWTPINLVVRYQLGALEPYAGVGMGVFFSRLSTEGFSSSSTDVGINTQVGLRYRVTPNVALFTEWKFNRATLSHTNLQGTGLDFSGNYNVHHLVVGVGYHF